MGYFLILPFLWSTSCAGLSGNARQRSAALRSDYHAVLAAFSDTQASGLMSERDSIASHGTSTVAAGARFATYPTYNHPVLLQGRKVLATGPFVDGRFDYGKANDQ